MLEVMSYMRANGFKTCIVTGFGQDFVRLNSQQVYGIPHEQVVAQRYPSNMTMARTAARS
jgi:hypothetical protein